VDVLVVSEFYSVFVLWRLILNVPLGLAVFPMKKYREHRHYIRKQKRKRQAVADKRLRYLYGKDGMGEEEEEVVVTAAEKAINQQIKFAQINAVYEAKNKAMLLEIEAKERAAAASAAAW
jgi:hypothetical protein